MTIRNRVDDILGRGESTLLDRWLGVRTDVRLLDSGAGSALGDANGHVPTPYELIYLYRRHLALGAEDVVVEVGCGSGRVLCALSRLPVKRCVGIELSAPLASLARENAARVRGRRAPVEVWCGDACEADYSEGTAFWLFDPFGPATLATVLERIRASLARNPRRLRFAYLCPRAEAAFHAAGWLERYRVDKAPWTSSPYIDRLGASFWRNREPTGA